MATFNEECENDLDYAALREGGVQIYRKADYLEEDIGWLIMHNYSVYRFDCSKWISENAMHENLQDALSFPDYYGKNLNALDEVLSDGDIDIPKDGGVLLVFVSYDIFVSRFREDGLLGESLLDILSRASHCLLLTGKRLITFIQSDDPSIHFPKLGGWAPGWNRHEWLHKDRGL